MTDRDKKILSIVIQGLLLLDADWVDIFLGDLKTRCESLSEELKKLTFVQCILNGNPELSREVLETARDFLYEDLMYSINFPTSKE